MKKSKFLLLFILVFVICSNTVQFPVQAQEIKTNLINRWYSDIFIETVNPERKTLSFDIVSQIHCPAIDYHRFNGGAFGQVISVLSSSKPIVNIDTSGTDSCGLTVLTYDVGTKLGFSFFDYAGEGYRPALVNNHYFISYWLDLLKPGMILLDNTDLQQSARVVGYGYEVTLTESMIGSHIHLSEVYGYRNYNLNVVPAGTLKTTKPDMRIAKDNQRLSFSKPIISRYGNTFVPIAGALTALTGDFVWDAKTETATARVNGNTVEVNMKHYYMSVNGRIVEPHNPLKQPFIYDNTYYVCMEALASALNLKQSWNSATKTLTISGAAPTYAPAAEPPAFTFMLEGKKIESKNQKPVKLFGDVLYIPVAPLYEIYGGDSVWDEKTQTLVIRYYDSEGNRQKYTFSVNSEIYTLDNRFANGGGNQLQGALGMPVILVNDTVMVSFESLFINRRMIPCKGNSFWGDKFCIGVWDEESQTYIHGCWSGAIVFAQEYLEDDFIIVEDYLHHIGASIGDGYGVAMKDDGSDVVIFVKSD